MHEFSQITVQVAVHTQSGHRVDRQILFNVVTFFEDQLH